MNVLSTMEKQVQMLEVVSETEESVTLDTEHEDGEIIDDDDDDFAPERRTPKKGSSVTSEVVIYDDHGRTAIFTSPKKMKSVRDPSSYPRISEGVRRWARDDANRRREKDEGDAKHKKDSDKERRKQNAQFDIVESGIKKGKRKQQTGRKVREVKKAEDTVAEDHQAHKMKLPHDPPHRHNTRHRRSSSSSDSESSTCSCSCSDDNDSSPRPQRGRGKENKRSSKQPPLLKPHSQKSSTKRASPHRSPPTQRKDGHRKSPSYSSHKFPKDLSRSRTYSYPNHRPYTKQNKTNVKRSSTLDEEKTSFKADQLPKEKPNDLILMKGQKQPPPGSLGEMLLKKTMKGKLKVHPEARETTAVTTDKDSELIKSVGVRERSVGESSTDHGQECYTLDQEDEDELQLRLIALQSSLRVLSDVRKEGQQDILCGLSLIERLTRTEENKGERENLSGQEHSNQLQPDRDKFTLIGTLENSLLQSKWKGSSHNTAGVVEQLNEGGKNYKKRNCGQNDDVGEIELTLDQSCQGSVRPVLAPDSPECEFEIGAIHTNKSYMDAIDSSNKLVESRVEDILGDTKELSDCNQDPVDMDICDSSAGEDDDDTLDEELFQEVGEDITLDNRNSPFTTGVIISDVLNNCPDNIKEGTTGPEGSQPTTSFQMPVEWAYMMPPPPPPDQPVNDISNINNWCYDQNMYLQTMQAPYDSSDHYNHYSLQSVCSADWGQQQSQSPEWSCPINKELENDSTDVACELPKRSVSEEGNKFDRDKVENSDVSRHTAEPQKDLKDLPAEHYQAFMSLVLKQQTAHPQHISASDALQRHLIEVPLMKNTNDTRHLADQQNNQLVSKRSEARRRKRERQKKIKLVKRKQGVKRWGVRKLEPVVIGIKPQQMIDSVTEEEDEDLLRAQLLIDLSRKKQQKAVESAVGHQVPPSVEKNVCLVREVWENSPPHGILSSSDSSPVPRLRGGKTALIKNIHLQKSRIKEGGSPTHINRVDMHPSLSDIGGFGLDPKSSRYDYLISSDPSIHTDVPKFKFPPVKPVIINLNSDSEEETEEGGMKDETSHERRKKEAESEASAIGTISSSIDHLLKAMRNAKPAGESKGIQDKPGSSGSDSSSKLKSKAASVDSTPSVVRHLSRTQQVEYHRLKEQLRKKELLHRRRQLQQQRPLATTRSKPVPLNTRLVTLSACSKSAGKGIGPSPDASRASLGGERYNKMVSSSSERENDLSESEEKLSGAASSGGMPSSREVSWKEMGMLQIQLPNVGSCDDHSSMTSMEDACEVGKNEHHHVANVNDPVIADESSREDEDEETLREMVLQTLQKKISERAKAEKLSETMTPEEENSQSLVSASKDGHVADVSEVSQAATTLKVVIHQKVDELTVTEAIQENSPDHCRVRNVVIEEESEDENNKEIIIHEGPQDEDIGGEWMVLDEVHEEGSDGNGCCRNRDGEDNEQHSTIENTKIKTESSRERSSCVSCDSETNDDDSKLDKTGTMFKEKTCIHLINDVRKTNGKGKETVGKDCLTVIYSSKQEGSSLEGKQKMCLGIGLLKEEEMQKKDVILDDQKVCEGSMIFCENRNKVIDDVGNMTGTSGLPPNDKFEERHTWHTSKMCGNGENLVAEGDDVSSCSAQTFTVNPFSVNAECVGTHRSESDGEKEIKPTGNLQHISKLRNCKDEGPASHKNSTVSIVKIEQHSHDLSVENPEKCASCSCHSIGQETAECFTDDSKLDTSSLEVKTFCQEMKKTGQEPEKGCSDVQTPQPGEVSVKLWGQSDADMKNKGVCTTRRNNTNRIQIQSSANDTISFSDCFKYPTDHSSGMKSGASVDTNAVDGNVKAQGGGKYEGKYEKSVETKGSLILKRIEHDYSEKRTGMNKVISQLTSLVQEATQEERQRQSLKKSVVQLSGQLKEMETQLETKSRALKTKMAHIRALQTQLTRDRQFISELERKGKLLGQQEYGSSYTLPKVLGSPNSKTKDTYRKKQLASNIDALRQQIRDVSNRSRARLEVAAQAEDIHDSIKKRGKVIKMMKNSCKDSKLAKETSSQNIHVGSSGVNNQGIIKAAIRIFYQSETTEDCVKQKCSKEATNNSLPSQRKIPLIETTANESSDNETQKVPLSSGHVLAKFAKTGDVRDCIFHRETEIHSLGKVHPSDVISNKVVEQISQKISTTHSERLEDEEMLDEMNVLCPYDLLGRCNDDSCTYQHLAQPRSGSHCLMKPSSLTVKTNAHMLRSHPKTKIGMDSEMGRRESKSMIEEVVPDAEIGIRALDIRRDKVGPETGTGRTRPDTGIGKTAVETEMIGMELNNRIRRTGSDIETGMMGAHTGAVKTEIDNRTEGIELDNRIKRIEPGAGTEWMRIDTGTLRMGTQILGTLIPDSGTGRVESDPGIRVIGLNTRNGKMVQEIGTGPVTEVGIMGSDSQKLGLEPDIRKRGLEHDTVKEGMRQDIKIGGTSQDTVMERLRLDAELGSKVMDIGLRRIERDNKTGRAGPETRMRRRESTDTGALKRNAGLESTCPDSGLGRTGPETGICSLVPHTVKDNISKRLIPTSKTRPMEDENGSGGGTTCERIITLSSGSENKCYDWENQANSDIKHDINASSNLTASSICRSFCKKEVPSLVNYENKHKNFKRKRSNEDDSLLRNLGIEDELQEGDEAKSKRTRQISGDPINEVYSPLAYSAGEESRVTDRNIHICHTKKNHRAVNTVTAERGMHDKIADKIPEMNASMVMSVEDIAAKTVNDLLHVSTDMPSNSLHMKDTESPLPVNTNCMMALEAAKPLLEGQVHDDQKSRVQEYEEEYRRKEEVSSGAVTLKISVKQTKVSEDSALEHPTEQQPQPDRFNLESELFNTEDEKNIKQLETVVEPSRSCDSDAVVSYRKRPATRKTTKIINNASFNENKNKAPTDHITTRRRGQELASRGSRRGRSKGSMEIFPQGGRSGCSEDSGASRRGPKRRAAHQKKNRGRNSVSRGRKK